MIKILVSTKISRFFSEINFEFFGLISKQLIKIKRMPKTQINGAMLSRKSTISVFWIGISLAKTVPLCIGKKVSGANTKIKPRPNELISQSFLSTVSQTASPLPKCQTVKNRKPTIAKLGRKIQTPTVKSAIKR